MYNYNNNNNNNTSNIYNSTTSNISSKSSTKRYYSNSSKFEIFKPKISVVGIGGGGGNVINHMIRKELKGVEFYVCNTDVQDLKKSLSKNRIPLGLKLTKGHGAGAKPHIGKMAAEESISDVITNLESSNLVFLAAGMGGGTGTGSIPVIARELKRMNNDVIVVAVVTKPFTFEGQIRQSHAQQGLKELAEHVDTLVVVSNDSLSKWVGKNCTMLEAFGYADEVLHGGVRSITNMINFPGLVNLDYSDIRGILAGRKGLSRLGVGEASGEDRALRAAYDAINHPLVEMDGAKSRGVLINFQGGDDVTIKEIGRAMSYIQEHSHPDAHIIIGHYHDSSLNGKIRISGLFVQ